MKEEKKEKNLELDRLVFFSDAVVAIAITLLALDLKLEPSIPGAITFSDLAHAWQKFVAFLLSFIYVAVFWKIHHQFFVHIRRIDERLLWYNVAWLLFIVTLPFSTSLISESFNNTPAMFLYTFNTMMITLFQNQIWDHVAVRSTLLKKDTDPEIVYNTRITCNVAMINGLMATIISLWFPVLAFIILTLRLPMIYMSIRIFNWK